jgi:hypothetical protein
MVLGAGGGVPSEDLCVIRLRKQFSVEKTMQGMSKETYQSHALYRNARTGQASFTPSSFVLVSGDLGAVKGAINRRGKSDLGAAFAAMPRTGQLIFGIRPKSERSMLSGAPIALDKATFIHGVIDFQADVRFQASLRFADPAAAQSFQQQTQSLLDQAKTGLALQQSGATQSGPGGDSLQSRIVADAPRIINSVSIQTVGDTTNLSATIPVSFCETLAKLSEQPALPFGRPRRMPPGFFPGR